MAAAKRRRTTKSTRENLYEAARALSSGSERELGVQIPFDMYAQDPSLLETDPDLVFLEAYVRWEPGLTDGPTSARFAVVDYNGDTGTLIPGATWEPKTECFLRPRRADEKVGRSAADRAKDVERRRLDRKNTDSLQFHQVNVWAVLQRTLEFFEAPTALGRPLPFGFEGNRLIVVPHAGYGRNAFYDRTSKSLQFYFFDNDDGDRIYTCLSADIINHEFAHAVLDGVRPYLMNSTLPETAAFHEFFGDITAILVALRHNAFRRRLAESSGGDLSAARHLSNIAEQFGKEITGKEYLRSATSTLTMSDIEPTDGPHKRSEVLTAAMFAILVALARGYRGRVEKRRRPKMRTIESDPDLTKKERAEKLSKEKASIAREAFWQAIQRMQSVVMQALDLLPPIDVTFEDFAMAVLRADELANPIDPHGQRPLMRKAFVSKGILSKAQAERQAELGDLFERLDVDIFHPVGRITRSRSAAYEFLNDNRDKLFIPFDQDITVVDLYEANKSLAGRRLPRQFVLCYLWREQVEITGRRFGKYDGKRTSLLCGGTLVLDEQGSVVEWSRKAGTQTGSPHERPTNRNYRASWEQRWADEKRRGDRRRKALLDSLASRIGAGHVGEEIGSSRGLLGRRIPPITVEAAGADLHFLRSPHMGLEGEDADIYNETGGARWEPSS